MLKSVSSITNAIGALNFKGTWDANANSPALASSVGTKGDYYVVGTAGSTNLNGISNWGVGDLATFNGSVWQRVEGGADLNGVNLSVSGTSTLSGLTASTALALNASKEIVSVTNTGTGNNVLASSPSITSPTFATDTTHSYLTASAAVATDANKKLVSVTNTGTGSNVLAAGPTFTGNTSFDTLQTSGKLSIGTAATAGVFHYVVGTNNSDVVAYWSNPLSTLAYTGIGNVTYAAGENGADAALFVRQSPTTSRSINAAGTVNASGTDYAEYMVKAGNFIIAKGDICGIDVNGKLTNVFADAVSFVVKSTNPSYVGGDTWGSEKSLGLIKPKQPADDATDEEKTQYATNKAAFDAALEAARQNVDRIAFCGQVPVNVTGATAGQYIIPVNDNGAIKGQTISNPTFEQYQQAVGKVISVTNGTPTIIVKIA